MNPETLDSFLQWRAPHRRQIISGGLLPAGQVMFIYGQYSTWKSWLAMDLAYNVSVGRPWLIFGTVTSKVLIINSEITKDSYQERWQGFVSARGISPNGNLLVDTDMELGLDTTTQAQNLAILIKHYAIKLLIIDNLYSATFGDITKNTDANTFIRNAKRIATDSSVAVVIVHHSHQPMYDANKGQFISNSGYEMFGSSFFTNWADTIMEARNVFREGYPDSVAITPQKHRLAKVKPLTTVFRFNRRTTQFDYVGW